MRASVLLNPRQVEALPNATPFGYQQLQPTVTGPVLQCLRHVLVARKKQLRGRAGQDAMVKKAAKKPAMEAEPKRRRKSAVSSPPAASPQIAEPKRRRKSVVSSSPRPTASPQTGRARSVEEAVPKGAESSVTSARATEPEDRGIAFLRLSAECRPSTTVSQLIYFNKESLTVGRMPNCDIVMDSTRFPQMISRTHARLVTTNVGTPQQEWAIHDCKSMNGVTVNGEAVGVSGRTLRMGDVVNFGKRVVPPEFEFIFEAPQSSGLAEELLVQMKRIADLEQELQKSEKKREAIPKGLKISELSNELACCVCKDWLVHAATIQCSHTFCWSCIDQWLQTKQFVCPVCRKEVTREPVRTRAVDAVVQKTVSQISAEEQAEFAARIKKAEVEDSTSQKHLEDLERQINEALRAGKKFFHINQLWGKKDKDACLKLVLSCRAPCLTIS
ncbi:unnamed protein product [Durusdinium trenchii]|uniref:E3 ubiquitin-protein ligase CHFR n=1 Tax=Durusdinium trenchii TaxID=1381693 RepID=A0ABP0RVJ6_9DINO